jgi:hypothetical protein
MGVSASMTSSSKTGAVPNLCLNGKPAVEGVLAAVGDWARKKERMGEVDGDGMVIL